MPDEPTPETGTTDAPSVDLSNLPDDHPLVKAYRATKAQLAEAKGKIQQAEDEGKTELQRLTDQVAQLTKDRDAASVERDRLQVALDRGLTKTQAKRLVGSTIDELTADADELLADLGKSPAGDDVDEPEADPAPGNRQESLSGGIDPTTTPTGSADVRAAVDRAVANGGF